MQTYWSYIVICKSDWNWKRTPKKCGPGPPTKMWPRAPHSLSPALVVYTVYHYKKHVWCTSKLISDWIIRYKSPYTVETFHLQILSCFLFLWLCKVKTIFVFTKLYIYNCIYNYIHNYIYNYTHNYIYNYIYIIIYIYIFMILINNSRGKDKGNQWRWLYIWYKILLIYINFNFDLLG